MKNSQAITIASILITIASTIITTAISFVGSEASDRSGDCIACSVIIQAPPAPRLTPLHPSRPQPSSPAPIWA